MMMSNKFLLEFIKCFQSQPALWLVKSDAYKNKKLRNKSWQVLLRKYKEVDEQATINTVKRKVNSLRASCRRELHKIKRSEKTDAGDDLYVPNIWYFDELKFVYEQESLVDVDNTFDDGFEIETPKAPKRKRDGGAKSLQEPVVHLVNINSLKQKDDTDIFTEDINFHLDNISSQKQKDDAEIYAKPKEATKRKCAGRAKFQQEAVEHLDNINSSSDDDGIYAEPKATKRKCGGGAKFQQEAVEPLDNIYSSSDDLGICAEATKGKCDGGAKFQKEAVAHCGKINSQKQRDDAFIYAEPKTTKHKCDGGDNFLQKLATHLHNNNVQKQRDDADIYAEGWAVMFRQMSKEQQLFAKKGIDELLTQGIMNMLTYQAVSSIGNLQNKNGSAPVYPMSECASSCNHGTDK